MCDLRVQDTFRPRFLCPLYAHIHEQNRRTLQRNTLTNHRPTCTVRGAAVSTEAVLRVSYQPLAVFRVRPVTRCTSTMPGHTEAVLHVSYSPDGSMLASGGGDMTVRLVVMFLVMFLGLVYYGFLQFQLYAQGLVRADRRVLDSIRMLLTCIRPHINADLRRRAVPKMRVKSFVFHMCCCAFPQCFGMTTQVLGCTDLAASFHMPRAQPSRPLHRVGAER